MPLSPVAEAHEYGNVLAKSVARHRSKVNKSTNTVTTFLVEI